MPFSSIPVVDMVTDAVNNFVSTKWRTLRDNLEFYHDHTSGKGKRLPLGSIAASAVTGVKFADGAVTAPKTLLTWGETKTTNNLAFGLGNDDDNDTEVTLTVPVACVAEIHYQFYYMDVFPATPAEWEARLKVNGSVQTNHTHYYNYSMGADLVTFVDVAAGATTFLYNWISGGLATKTLYGPRKMLVLLYGRA